jgi:hypothetical protein
MHAYYGVMTRLPNSSHAFLDIRKLQSYCLDRDHPRGRHKARIFREILGIERTDAAWLRQTLLDGARDNDAVELVTDRFGSRWRVDVAVTRQERTAVVRSIWIVRTGEDVPRFVSCWIL